MKRFQSSTPVAVLSLILANLVPLLWSEQLNLYSMLYIYWLETFIIGCYNIMKIATIKKSYSAKTVRNFATTWTIALGIYLSFISLIFPEFGDFEAGLPSEGLLITMFFVYAYSHGISFWQNFIGKREYKSTTAKEQFKVPAGRLIVLHFSVVVGVFVLGGRLAPMIAMYLFVALKTLIDLDAHFKEHASAALRAQRLTVREASAGI